MYHVHDGTLLMFVAVACISLGRPWIATGLGLLAVLVITR